MGYLGVWGGVALVCVGSGVVIDVRLMVFSMCSYCRFLDDSILKFVRLLSFLGFDHIDD